MQNVAKVYKEDLGNNTTFLKDLTRYYMDFLETDFHKRPLPKRYIRLRDPNGQLAGINLRKFEGFRAEMWKMLTEPAQLNYAVEIKRGQYKSRIKTSLKNFIDQSVEELEQKILDEVTVEVFKDFKKYKQQFHDNWDSFHEESVEAVKQTVLKKIVEPLSDVLEKPLTDEKALGLETILELQDDLIALICADITDGIDKPLIKFFNKGEIEELAAFLADMLRRDIVAEKLKIFFANFSSSDLFLEFNEMFENKRLHEKEEIYFYLCDISYDKKNYPLFYFSLQIEKNVNSFIVRFEPHILVNKKAIEYIIQEYNKQTSKAGGIRSLKDRILYLKPDEEDFITKHLQPIISDISSHFSMSDTVDLELEKPKQQRSLLVNITNDIYFCLFDRADEALVNDYEELLHLVEAGDNPLSEAFINLISGYILADPKSYRDEVEKEWDNRGVPERLVYDAPIPLNEEQRKILSALKKKGCNYVAVQGPPGTGKSHTITAIAFDAIMKNSSVLILSDKKEALDVVENKIVDTLNKVRISDDFQNPILRLDKPNFGKIFTAGVIAKIDQAYKASKQREEEIETLLTAKQDTLQNSLEETIEQYESISLKEIKEFLDLEKEVVAKIDLKQLKSLESEDNALAILHQFLSCIERCLDAAEYNFFVDALAKGNKDWYSDDIEENLHLLNFSSELKTEGYADELAILLNVQEDTHSKLQEYINRYKLLTSGFLKGLFKRGEIKRLDIELNSAFEFSRSLSFLQDLSYLEKALSCIARIKNRLRQIEVSEDKFLQVYKIFSNPNCPNSAFLDKFTVLSEVISLNLPALKPSLDTLKIDLTFDATKKHKSVRSSVDTLSLLLKYQEKKQKLFDAFGKIPDVDYASACSQLEQLQTAKMTNLIDKRVLDFAHNNKATAQTLKKIISKKQKFPREEFEKIKEAFPCIIAGIRDYAEYIPLEKDLFDLVIIDEASQVSIAQAFPAILRAKSILVLGDNKQFSNVKTSNASNVINHRYMNDIKTSFLNHIANDPAKLVRVQQFNIKTSILEFFDYISNYNVMLKKHFRGYRELISFSSRWFYEGHLQAIKIRGKRIEDVIKFTVLEHDGLTETKGNANTNPLEAKFIIQELETMVEEDNPMSVGIITPFSNQQKILSNEVSKSEYADEIYHKLKLKIMTFDTCQGEERDIIFYSMVASPVSDKTNYIFATDLKSNDDDEKKIRLQRLNVGFSRSKECMHFVLSKPIESFDGSLGTALKHYKKQLEQASLAPTEADVDPSSPMEKNVLNWIKDTSFYQTNRDNIDLHAQFPIGDYLKQLDQGYNHPSYRCDFLLQYTKDDKTINIIIEYDGFKEHFTNWEDVNALNYQSYYKSADIEREKILESYGYKFIRINRFNLGEDPIETLSNRLDNLVKKKTTILN
jgi:hypothetical protein